uniref:Dihydrolipoamide acetyltransferase component of pyruvate dehydrogenase complex n=1 Tax=Bionectria ochroleuca TaxID=29856 RepID=A0A0B7JKN0_BIOOC
MPALQGQALLRLSQALRSASRARISPIPPSYLRPSCVLRSLSTSRWLLEEYTVKVPPMAESISEGTLSQFLKAVGEHVEMDEEIATIETDKIDVSVNAPKAGVLTKLLVQEGDVVTLEQGLAVLDTDGTPSPDVQSKPFASSVAPHEGEKSPPTTEGSALNATQNANFVSTSQATVPPPTPKKQENVVTAPAPSQSIQREKLSRMRKTIATRLKESQNRCASLTTVQRVDMSALMDWRAKYKESVAKVHDVRLGYMGAFAKATSLAAQQVPQVNASIDTDREIITYRDYVDISIAVSTPKGLVTPVIRNCESKSIIELERVIGAMAKKARDGKLTMADLEGGNYSISNPGIFGSMFGTPLINYPQAAVFNMNSIKEDVVAINGKVEIRPMMYITITYDHRLIDGREAVTFLNLVKGYIEDPSRMLLG